MNSLEQRLKNLKVQLAASNAEAASYRAQKSFYDTFDETSCRKKTESLRERLDELRAKQRKRDSEYRYGFGATPSIGLAMAVPTVLGKVLAGLIVGGVGVASLRRQEAEHSSARLATASSIKSIEVEIAEIQHSQARYAAIDVRQLNQSLRASERNARYFEEGIDAVSEKLCTLRSEIGETLDTQAMCVEDRSAAEAAIQKGKDFIARLERTASSSERAAIHAECSDELGDGKPLKVIEKCNRKIEHIDLQLAKICQLVDRKIQLLDAPILRAFLDGNNLCNDRSGWIGLDAVKAIASKLKADGLQVTVFFDQLIGPTAHRIAFDDAKSQFESGITVEQKRGSKGADPLLLLSASEVTDCVVSNDSFKDYAHLPAKKNDRVFDALFVDSFVIIEELNLKVQYKKC